MPAAAVAGWLCRRFGLPLILGYITAGILIGPHVPCFSMADDIIRIHALAQVGLVVLVCQIVSPAEVEDLIRCGKLASAEGAFCVPTELVSSVIA